MCTLLLLNKLHVSVLYLFQTDLSRVYTTAAGFVFMSQYYYLSWGHSGDVNNLMLGRYINREDSDPRLDQEKLIFKTKEAKPGTVHTHKIDPKDGHEL